MLIKCVAALDCSSRQLRMDRVSVDELRELIDDNKINAIVDVRSPITQAATGRIPGARTIDMQKITESFKGVPVDGEVVVYCACPERSDRGQGRAVARASSASSASARCTAASMRGSRRGSPSSISRATTC